jgi:hypothetical protein
VPASKAKALPRTLEDILDEFGPVDKVQFDPFIPKARTQARAILPHSFLSIPQLFDYFSLFFIDNLWRTNTNRYAAF